MIAVSFGLHIGALVFFTLIPSFLPARGATPMVYTVDLVDLPPLPEPSGPPAGTPIEPPATEPEPEPVKVEPPPPEKKQQPPPKKEPVPVPRKKPPEKPEEAAQRPPEIKPEPKPSPPADPEPDPAPSPGGSPPGESADPEAPRETDVSPGPVATAPDRVEESTMDQFNTVFNSVVRLAGRLDKGNWLLVLIAVVVVGFCCLRGFGSRSDY